MPADAQSRLPSGPVLISACLAGRAWPLRRLLQSRRSGRPSGCRGPGRPRLPRGGRGSWDASASRRDRRRRRLGRARRWGAGGDGAGQGRHGRLPGGGAPGPRGLPEIGGEGRDPQGPEPVVWQGLDLRRHLHPHSSPAMASPLPCSVSRGARCSRTRT